MGGESAGGGNGLRNNMWDATFIGNNNDHPNETGMNPFPPIAWVLNVELTGCTCFLTVNSN